MLDTFVWWRGLPPGSLASGVADLRRDALRLLLGLATVSYCAWHIVRTYESGVRGLEHWPLLPVAGAALAGPYWLLARCPTLAPWCFLSGSAASLLAAAWLLEATLPVALLPLLTLAAVVLLHPLAGLLSGGLSLGALTALRALGPLAFVGDDLLVTTGIVSLATVMAAWALARNLVIAVDWSAKSHAEAWVKTAEARANRAELVQALKQLDHAYYSLQRANAALELAWKAADAAERSKTEFVTNISHELRTPLNLIIGFSEMILTAPESYDAPLPATYRGDLNAIYRSAEHLLTLTNDVIDLARVGMGRLALAREPVALAEVIRDASAMIQQYIEAKGLWLRLEIATDLPTLYLDRLRIRQVLLNLLTNAARFTERGGVTVAARVADGGRAVVVEVADTGRGIAPDDLSKIFKEFYSGGGDSTVVTRELGGVGLGLPLSRRLIELHGGQMGVDSTLGVGSRFWCEFPLAARVPSTAERRAPGVASRPAGERLLVLTGSDEPARVLFQRHLHGYRLLPAVDGARAAVLATELRAEAIVADSAQPSPVDCPTPIFQLALPHGDRLAASLGASAWLTKPLTRDTLYRMIEQVAPSARALLIVDDDPRFVRLLTRMLRAAPGGPGMTIRSAPNGREALAAMEDDPPDLVLLDFVMPELDGRATLAAMRRRPALAAIPVIMISAQDQFKAQFPLPGPLTIFKRDGFQLEEALGAIDAVLSVLRPPQDYLAQSGPPTDPTAGMAPIHRGGADDAVEMPEDTVATRDRPPVSPSAASPP